MGSGRSAAARCPAEDRGARPPEPTGGAHAHASRRSARHRRTGGDRGAHTCELAPPARGVQSSSRRLLPHGYESWAGSLEGGVASREDVVRSAAEARPRSRTAFASGRCGRSVVDGSGAGVLAERQLHGGGRTVRFDDVDRSCLAGREDRRGHAPAPFAPSVTARSGVDAPTGTSTLRSVSAATSMTNTAIALVDGPADGLCGHAMWVLSGKRPPAANATAIHDRGVWRRVHRPIDAVAVQPDDAVGLATRALPAPRGRVSALIRPALRAPSAVRTDPRRRCGRHLTNSYSRVAAATTPLARERHRCRRASTVGTPGSTRRDRAVDPGSRAGGELPGPS